ncbi:hypothetical protein NDK47_18355 [Brevibacillus ruminantium]|uniref:Uncharacterized protein n=1 Tax=Brevibacillus ruminantium TaxID=2950604 RepID=A0ABY4WBA1_9BACL|nr:hypothetical protein [Brevibacillus ruminantium]USG64111.1 hypothetical protein NDK47_18355 [Brevibacillus ruminantium]
MRFSPYAYLLSFILLFVTAIPVEAAKLRGREEMLIQVSVSPDSTLVSKQTVHSSSTLARMLTKGPGLDEKREPRPVRATIQVKGRTFLLGFDGALYDRSRKKLVRLPPESFRELDGYVTVLEQRHYGKPIPWSEVRQHFRRMSYATVIDLETGKQFRVQRRAGSRHADVQPVTRQDTKIMKQIYQGKWSWKRRAILVDVDGKHYAASMHGMPHGAGAIKGNQFPGHFCIHFTGSSTHRKKEPDPSHSFMILKASGKLYAAILSADPQKLVDYFLTSLHEHDRYSLRLAADNFPLPDPLKNIESIKRQSPFAKLETDGLLAVSIPVQVEYAYKTGPARGGTWIFSVARYTPLDPWRIADIHIEKKSTKKKKKSRTKRS